MISPTQVFLAILIIFIMLRTLSAYKAKKLSANFTFIWLTFWLGPLILIFQQEFITGLAHRLGVSRGVDLIIYTATIIIFYLIYRLMVYIKEVDRKITEIVRKMALRDR